MYFSNVIISDIYDIIYICFKTFFILSEENDNVNENKRENEKYCELPETSATQ